MSRPDLVLHIGAPKCGSSSIQTAFSREPDATGRDDYLYRYVGTSGGGVREPALVYGDAVTAISQRSPFGYTTQPELSVHSDHGAVFTGLAQALEDGRREGFVPILSNENWINFPDLFAEHLAMLGHPQV